MPQSQPEVEIKTETTTTTVTVDKSPETKPDNWVTLLVIGATLGALLLGVIFWAFGWKFGLVIGAYLVFESWTLLNKYKEDTLSEGFWTLSQRPVFIMLWCIIVGVTVGQGIWGDLKTVVRGMMLGGIMVHFWFSRDARKFVFNTSYLNGNGK